MIRPKVVFRSIVVGAGLIGLALLVPRTHGRADADPPQPGTRVVATPSSVVRRIGNDSCLARGCHGAVGALDPDEGHYYLKGGEATTWRSFDPHARAYDVLLNDRSKVIGKNLSSEMKGQPPHRSKLCLDCHSTGVAPPITDTKERTDFAAGVDCETCHGPASVWVDSHLTGSWMSRSAKEKKQDGYEPLIDLASRAKLCVSCHVGDSTKQVNHDLIAAGHPRLIFDLDANLTALPRHWQEPHEKPDAKGSAGSYHANAWAVGQVQTMDAALGLLKARALSASQDKAPWPEFTEYDCYACHHQLASPSWRQADPSRQPAGSLPWGSWILPTTLGLTKSQGVMSDSPLLNLKKEMTRPMPNPAQVAKLAEEATQMLRAWSSSSESVAFDAKRTDSLLRSFLDAKAKSANWDEAVARSLAVTSLSKTIRDLTGKPIDPDLEKEASKLRSSLDFPQTLDSPKEFHP